MSKKDVQLNIRMTQELKDKIEASAKVNNRTINAEAITLIEKSLLESSLDSELKSINYEIDETTKDVLKKTSKNKSDLEELIEKVYIDRYGSIKVNIIKELIRLAVMEALPDLKHKLTKKTD